MKTAARLLLLLALARWSSAEIQRDLEYGRAAGESLKLDACVPEGTGPFPAVILVHGGGWTKGDKSGVEGFLPLQGPLERAGFAWFSINYRLAPKHSHPAQVEDVETAMRWVKSNAARFHVDPQRIVLCGESSGGHIVLLAMVRASGETRPAAVVSFYAPVDFLHDPIANGEELPPLVAGFIGRTRMDDATRELLRNASPAALVKPGLPPVLLLHGTADDGIPFARSTLMQSRLKQANVPCDLIAIPNDGHGFEEWDDIAPNYKEQVIAWLKKTLKIDVERGAAR